MVWRMTQVGMHEAKTKLSQLVKRAEDGEEIVITRNGTPVAKLAPVPKPNRMASILGIYKDSPAVFHGDWNELPDDIAEAFGMKD